MPRRRSLLRALGAAATAGAAALAGCGGDGGTTTAAAGGDGTTMVDDFEISSEAFSEGASIPDRYTADGADVSPPLSVSGFPEGTETWALIVDDPDAPGGTFVHWLLWNVPADRTTLPEGVPDGRTVDALGGARQGTNDFDVVGYRGPAPPAEDGPHTYRFTAYAVDSTLSVEGGAGRPDLEAGLEGSTLGTARLSGEYDR